MDASTIKTITLFDNVKISGHSNEYYLSKIEQSENFHEKELLEKWFVRKDYAVIYDIGSNIGNHTMYFAINTSHSQIYSFEPCPSSFELLEKNILENNLEYCVHVFQSDWSDIQNEGAEVIRDYLGVQAPHFIRVGAKCCTLEVIKGIERTLNQADELTVWLELAGDDIGAIYDLMTGMGYVIVDMSLGASNNVLWVKGKEGVLDDKELFVRLISNDEQSVLTKKLSEATAGLGKSLLLLNTVIDGQQQLKAQVAVLQKENEQYKQKINRIKNTWYGRLAMLGYSLLNRGKRFVYRIIKKG